MSVSVVCVHPGATLPDRFSVSLPATARGGKAGLNVTASFADAFGQVVSTWPDLQLQVTQTVQSKTTAVSAANANNANSNSSLTAGAAAAAAALQGLTYAELSGGIAEWDDLGLFGASEGAQYELAVILRSAPLYPRIPPHPFLGPYIHCSLIASASRIRIPRRRAGPTLPHLAGTLLTANVTVARCTPDEIFSEGECVCKPGRFRPLGAAAGDPCRPCPTGSYSSAPRATACGLCSASSVAAAPGSTACEPCPDFSKASADRTACLCRSGYYARNLEGISAEDPALIAESAAAASAVSGTATYGAAAASSASLTPGSPAPPPPLDSRALARRLAVVNPSDLRCAPCPVGAVCPGEEAGGLLFTGEGFWRQTVAGPLATKFYKCAPGVRRKTKQPSSFSPLINPRIS